MKTKEERAAYSKAYYQANRKKILAQQAIYNEDTKEEKATYDKAHYEANKEKISARKVTYYQANKEKSKAHSAVSGAIKSGKLVRLPCSDCGETNTEAHHYAYDMPLDVIWLCSKHHGQLHREHRGYEQLSQ